MEITFSARSGYWLNVKAENVAIEEDVESRVYTKKEGKIDYSVPVKRDVKTEALDTFARILDDMVYYREEPYDSSDLIERLVDKLPGGKVGELIRKLQNTHL